ncbi:MarR family transcriptional regulator [Corynebacterium sp. H127]|uniref:MarR family transcriptional regulator n=1 Tax=Corynebacterium sp. H127 TaxID=3133418 RepID=UPI00309F7AC7
MPTPFDPVLEAQRNWQQRGWESASQGMATVTSLVRIGALLSVQADAILRPFGISFSRYELLTLLMFSRSGALPMKKASSRLNIPPASVTHMVTVLEKDGLVSRSRDPKDGRGILVSITDQGIALVSSATPALNEFFESLNVQPDLLAELTAFRRTLGDA